MGERLEPDVYDDRMRRQVCICCGLAGHEQHHGQWWCHICIGRGHYQDGPYLRAENGDGDEPA